MLDRAFQKKILVKKKTKKSVGLRAKGVGFLLKFWVLVT